MKNSTLQKFLANKYVQIGGVLLIIINTILVNAFVYFAAKPTSTTTTASSLQKPIAAPVSNVTTEKTYCASSEARLELALLKISEIQAVLSATPKNTAPNPTPTPASPTTTPTSTPRPTATPTGTITPTPTPSVTVSGVKEYYVIFGSGNSSSSDWADVGGLQSSINTMLYPTIKTATFEVSGHTPTGNEIIWVRLYNSTDGYPMPNSEVTWAGGGNQNVTASITIPSGNKTYKVQMKTQLGYISYIDSAKIHLILY